MIILLFTTVIGVILIAGCFAAIKGLDLIAERECLLKKQEIEDIANSTRIQ